MDLTLFDEYLQDETSVYILKACREISQSFEDILRGVRLLKNLEIFRVNTETVIEFVFRMM